MSEEIARSAGSGAPLYWLYILRILGTPPFSGTGLAVHAAYISQCLAWLYILETDSYDLE
jgi:hypothetical protein